MKSKIITPPPWHKIIIDLKAIKLSKGITLAQISDRSGIMSTHISKFFSLKKNPRISTVISIAKALEVDQKLLKALEK